MGLFGGMFAHGAGYSSERDMGSSAYNASSDGSDDNLSGFSVPMPPEALLIARQCVADSSKVNEPWTALRSLIRVCDLAEKLACAFNGGQPAKVAMACHAIQGQLLLRADELDRHKSNVGVRFALQQLDIAVTHACSNLGRMRANGSSLRWFAYRSIKKILKEVDFAAKGLVGALLEVSTSEARPARVSGDALGRHPPAWPGPRPHGEGPTNRGPGVSPAQGMRQREIPQGPPGEHLKGRSGGTGARPSAEGAAVASAAGHALTNGATRQTRTQSLSATQADAQVLEGTRWLEGKDGLPVNYGRAFTLFQAAALAGHAAAQCKVGHMFRYGLGTAPDPSAALSWYERAARAGDVEALVALGSLAEEGEGQPQDYQAAAAFYAAAADEGNTEAQANLAYLYEKGLGLPQDVHKALLWYRRAADTGNARAQNNLGKLLFEGLGVPRDYIQAVGWFTLAAQQGNASALNNLGICYEDGLGVECDMIAAARLYQQAAAKEHTGACTNLAYIALQNGQFVEAEQLYQRAAGHNSAEALYSLGLLCEHGRGSPRATLAGSGTRSKREEMALHFYLRAADMGDARAQCRAAGAMYDNGNLEGALRYYRMSAAQENGEALNALGIMHEEGLGIPASASAALDLYSRSAAQGCEEGQKNLQGLQARVDASAATPELHTARPLWSSRGGESGSADGGSARGGSSTATADGEWLELLVGEGEGEGEGPRAVVAAAEGGASSRDLPDTLRPQHAAAPSAGQHADGGRAVKEASAPPLRGPRDAAPPPLLGALQRRVESSPPECAAEGEGGVPQLRRRARSEVVMPLGVHVGPTAGFAIFPSKGGGDAPLDVPLERAAAILRAHAAARERRPGPSRASMDLQDSQGSLRAALHIGPGMLGGVSPAGGPTVWEEAAWARVRAPAPRSVHAAPVPPAAEPATGAAAPRSSSSTSDGHVQSAQRPPSPPPPAPVLASAVSLAPREAPASGSNREAGVGASTSGTAGPSSVVEVTAAPSTQAVSVGTNGEAAAAQPSASADSRQELGRKAAAGSNGAQLSTKDSQDERLARLRVPPSGTSSAAPTASNGQAIAWAAGGTRLLVPGESPDYAELEIPHHLWPRPVKARPAQPVKTAGSSSLPGVQAQARAAPAAASSHAPPKKGAADLARSLVNKAASMPALAIGSRSAKPSNRSQREGERGRLSPQRLAQSISLGRLAPPASTAGSTGHRDAWRAGGGTLSSGRAADLPGRSGGGWGLHYLRGDSSSGRPSRPQRSTSVLHGRPTADLPTTNNDKREASMFINNLRRLRRSLGSGYHAEQ